MSKQQQGAPQRTPVKGSAITSSDAALQILVERMDQLGYAIRSLDNRLEQLQGGQDEAKRQSAQALEAAKEALQKVQEATPDDPKTKQALIDYHQKKAQEQAAKKKAKFIEQLKDAPLGVLYNHTAEPLKVGINGVIITVQPGESKEVPAPFVDQYEKQQKLAKWALEQDQAVRIDNPGGILPYQKMQQWRADNTFNSDKEIGSWHDDAGAV